MSTKKKVSTPDTSKKKQEEKKRELKPGLVPIRHTFTDAELVALMRTASDAKKLIVKKEQEFDSIKAAHKADIMGIEARLDAAFGQYDAGFEMRPTNVLIEFGKPGPGRKTIYAFDATKADNLGEFICDELMTPSEMQPELIPAIDGEQITEDMMTQATNILRCHGNAFTDDQRADLPAFIAIGGPEDIGIDYPRACKVIEVLENRGVVTQMKWETDDGDTGPTAQRRLVIPSGINPVIPEVTKEQVTEYLNKE